MNKGVSTYKELDIINDIRGKVISYGERTGINLFLMFGYISFLVFLTEFVALQLWHTNLCEWLWAVIPIIGVPLLVYFIRKDFYRTGRRTLNENIALNLWIFIGCASAVSGFITGLTGVYELCYCLIQGLLVSMGCFLTGVIVRFRPMVACGIVGAMMSFLCLFFQGEQWSWQLFIMTLIITITLIVPGHFYRSHIIKERNEFV